MKKQGLLYYLRRNVMKKLTTTLFLLVLFLAGCSQSIQEEKLGISSSPSGGFQVNPSVQKLQKNRILQDKLQIPYKTINVEEPEVSSSSLPEEVTDPHHGRSLVFEANDVKASIGGELGGFVVVDNPKSAGGGEARIHSFLKLKGDVTKEINENNILGVGVETIEPDSMLVDLQDDRANRVRARGYFYSPQWPKIKGYWRNTGEHELWEVGVGRDRFLGYDQFMGEYQGAAPLLLKYSWHYDNGIELRHERYTGMRKLYSFQLSVLDSEGWLGMEDEWFANSYFRFGVETEIHLSHLLGLPELGDFSLISSWTNAEGGSATGGGKPGAKESFEHFIYGIQYDSNPWGLDFKTRFLAGEITRGKNHNNHEETTGWVWETLLGGFKWGKSFLDVVASISSAEYEGGEKFWIWKGSATYEEQYKLGFQIREAFGVKGLSFQAEYFQKDMDGHSSWTTLGEDDGFLVGAKYEF